MRFIGLFPPHMNTGVLVFINKKKVGREGLSIEDACKQSVFPKNLLVSVQNLITYNRLQN
jgi:hypothetical protein